MESVINRDRIRKFESAIAFNEDNFQNKFRNVSQLLRIRKEYAEYYYTSNPDQQGVIEEHIDYCNEKIKLILGL